MPSLSEYKTYLSRHGGAVGQAHKSIADTIMEQTWDRDIQSKKCYIYDYYHDDQPTFSYKNNYYMYGYIRVPGTSLVKPWVYKEGNSFGNTQVCPNFWIGGFNCENVMYIENIFEGADGLYYMEQLNDLGHSFSTIQLLDFSQSSLNDRAGWYRSEPTFSKLADTVYDFSQGPNQYGIEYAEVKFGGNFIEQESKDKWIAKGWRVVE